MLYIISEDSISGFEFWTEFNRIILEDKAIVQHSGKDDDETGGIDKILNKVVSLDLTIKDTLFVSIDIQDLRAIQIIENLKKDAKVRGYKGFHTTYSCLEEVFLSFDRLVDWCQIDYKNARLLEIYQSIQAKILGGSETFDICNKSQDVIDLENIINDIYAGEKSYHTKAQMYTSLLSEITNPANDKAGKDRPWFHIKKSRIRECWVRSCPFKKQFCVKCQCKLLVQKLSDKAKMEILIEESVLNTQKYSILELIKYV